MKKFIYPLFFTLLFSFVTVGCNSNKSTEVVAMENEIMRIHDEVMDKMGEVKKLQGKMEQVMIKSSKNDMGGAVAEVKKAQEARKDLGEAHDAMMTWMRQYNPDKHEEKEKALAYLAEQEKNIIAVADKINNSITSANKILSASE